MPDEPYQPHKLVIDLARALEKAKEERSDERRTDTDEMTLANGIANDPSLGELYTFAGYLGGTLDENPKTTPTTWRLLYLDAKLRSWLLVGEDSILHRMDVPDDTSPTGNRDHIWVKADASVSQGEGAPQKNEIQARFLRGDFVSAGDFAASVTGGTFAPVTGPLCPLTPGCCGKRTR